MTNGILSATVGGAVIGIAVTMMLLLNGRVTGISGIVSSALTKPTKDGIWRVTFIIGMLVGGLTMHLANRELFVNLSGRNNLEIALAGLLVGYGTVMGSGCTSGHGVCGISRFSVRSVLATMTFMLFGFLTVQALRIILGGGS